MRALVTGGSGFVGGHVVRTLLERGVAVRCLVRDPARPGALDGCDVELAPGDLLDRAAVQRAARDVDHVYHCAADYRLWVPDPGRMYASNVEGTRHVMEAAAAAGAARVVHTSSVGALGRLPGGRPADETTPVRLDDLVGPYKRSKYLADRVADEWAARGLHVVIVHPSTPVGERDVKPTATGQMIVDFLRGRMRAWVDTGLNLIDVRDVAEGHRLAAERGVRGERYILGHENLTLREIFERLARVTGRPAPRLRLPHAVPWIAAWVDTTLARLTARPPRIPLDAVRMSRHRMFFDSARAVRELGLPQSPIDAALERAVRWFVEHGHAGGPGPASV